MAETWNGFFPNFLLRPTLYPPLNPTHCHISSFPHFQAMVGRVDANECGNVLEVVFKTFCQHGAGSRRHIVWDMDGTRWSKWCRETGVVGYNACSLTMVDLAFSKSLAHTPRRRVDYLTLRGTLIPTLARDMGVATTTVEDLLCSGQPGNSNTSLVRLPTPPQPFRQPAALYDTSKRVRHREQPKEQPWEREQPSDHTVLYASALDDDDDAHYEHPQLEYRQSPPPPNNAVYAMPPYVQPQSSHSPVDDPDRSPWFKRSRRPPGSSPPTLAQRPTPGVYVQPSATLTPPLPEAVRTSTEYLLMHEAHDYREQLLGGPAGW